MITWRRLSTPASLGGDSLTTTWRGRRRETSGAYDAEERIVLKSAYFQCIGGASGDMILGAAVDAGAPISEIDRVLSKLKVGGFSLGAEPGRRGGLNGTVVTVDLDDEGRRTRCFSDFIDIVERSDLPANVVENARAVFGRLREAESQVHGTSQGEPELHELGEVDTLVDVVGSVVALELLGVERVYSSPLPSGSGVIKSAHGVLPVPAPATAALLAMAGAPIVPPPGGAPDTGEMVTPTGAAILTTLATFHQPVMKLERVGYGLGSRDPERYPNALGMWVGEEAGAAYATGLSVIETNIDDMSAEMLGYVQERLFQIGARDVWFTPIQMKKSRPGTMLSAIVPSTLDGEAIELVLRETTTLGVRVRPLERYEAERETVDVDTSIGRVPVKVKRLDGRNVSVSPEYEVCRTIAREQGLALQEVYRRVQREVEQVLLED